MIKMRSIKISYSLYRHLMVQSLISQSNNTNSLSHVTAIPDQQLLRNQLMISKHINFSLLLRNLTTKAMQAALQLRTAMKIKFMCIKLT